MAGLPTPTPLRKFYYITWVPLLNLWLDYISLNYVISLTFTTKIHYFRSTFGNNPAIYKYQAKLNTVRPTLYYTFHFLTKFIPPDIKLEHRTISSPYVKFLKHIEPLSDR